LDSAARQAEKLDPPVRAIAENHLASQARPLAALTDPNWRHIAEAKLPAFRLRQIAFRWMGATSKLDRPALCHAARPTGPWRLDPAHGSRDQSLC